MWYCMISWRSSSSRWCSHFMFYYMVILQATLHRLLPLVNFHVIKLLALLSELPARFTSFLF